MISRKSVTISTALTGFFLLTCYTFGRSQDHQYSLPKRDPAIKVDVDMVTIAVTVTDQNGRAVTGLEREDFRVWEDKVEQQIVSFDAEEAPASIGIVLDVSDSMKRKISAARDAAATFLKSGNNNDEYFVIEFSNRARITQKFTSDISKLWNSITPGRTYGMTAMYDALYLGMEQVKSGHNGKKALLLITDGDDNRSRYTASEIDEFLKETDIHIYPIGIVDGMAEADSADDERDDLQQLADVSGGDAFFPDSSRDLENICTMVALELKNQYVIGYKSTNSAKDSRWRRLRIRVRRPGLRHVTVRSRSGYYAPSD
jgi:Ca-activated chloride channel family protein